MLPFTSKPQRVLRRCLPLGVCALFACTPQPSAKTANAESEIELGSNVQPDHGAVATPAPGSVSLPNKQGAAEPEAAQKVWAPKQAMCIDGDQCPAAVASGATSAPAPLADLNKLDAQQRYAVPINSDDPSKGSRNAPVHVVVFSDFQCPFCRHLDQTLGNLKEAYGDRLQLVWKDLPLGNHRFARPAALLAREALAKRGNDAFWQVHDTLYAEQPLLSDAVLASVAQRFGLSWPPDEQYAVSLQRSEQEAQRLQVPATPTTFVNGYPVIGAKRFSVFQELIERELAAGKTAAPQSPTAQFTTAQSPTAQFTTAQPPAR